MKKIIVLSGGLVVAGSAALIGAGVALSQPSGPSPYNVTGEQFFQPFTAEGQTTVLRV